MARAAGLEPTNAGVRVPCLTSLATPQLTYKKSLIDINIIYNYFDLVKQKYLGPTACRSSVVSTHHFIR